MKRRKILLGLGLCLLAALLCLSGCGAALEALTQASASSGDAVPDAGQELQLLPEAPEPEAPPESDAIPYSQTPTVTSVPLPEEELTDPLEREAAALTDKAISRALGCLQAMRDDRHTARALPFSEDPAGVLEELTPAQRELYETVTAAARSWQEVTVSEQDFAGDLGAAYFAVSRALPYCDPELACWFDFGSVAGIRQDDTAYTRSVYGYFFDPEADENERLAPGEKLEHAAALLEAVVDRIVRFMPEGLSGYDQYYYLAAVLSERVTYDKNPANCFTAYGALVGGRAVCEGYAEAYYLLCRRAGLWCAFRDGQVEGQGHGWNMVQLETGINNVDVTWCDAAFQPPYVREWYDSFMRTDEEFAESGHQPTWGITSTGAGEKCPYDG